MTAGTTTTTTDLQTQTVHLEPRDYPDLPPFPSDVPTAPLHRVSLSLLRSDPGESARFFAAGKELGFFYLDLQGDEEGEALLQLSTQLFDLGPKLFDLGPEVLSRYDYKSVGSYMGYKGFGSAIVDEKGNLDRNEFYNMPKDDFLDISASPFAHPDILHQHKDVLTSYIRTSHSVVSFLLQHLNANLNLCPGILPRLHQLHEPSGDQIRIVKSPPQPETDSRTAMGKHTDYGSLTLLFNRLGGLQILPPPSLVPAGEAPVWTYVRPLPGHCIVNLGDAMTKFSGGILRSNIHRVVAPPGAQAAETRWSVVYFARPEDEVKLTRLRDVKGDLLGEGAQADERQGEAMSAKKWIELQAMRLRKVRPDMTEAEKEKLWQESERGE